MSARRIAIVVPALTYGGGVPAVGAFLYRIISASGRYQPELISLATSANDDASVRLLAPSSWLRGPQLQAGVWEERPFRHAGALLTEFEFQRYQPRRRLTELLGNYDLIQVVAGSPAWALVSQRVRRPVLLQAATLVEVERAALLARSRGARRVWQRWMTKITAQLEQRSLKLAATVFVENEWMRQRLENLLTPEKVVFAPPGVDTELFYPAAHGAQDYILSVGRFADARKNVRMLFEAYHHLRTQMATAPGLLLAGQSAPAQADWQRAKELGIDQLIEFKPDVPLTELAELYRNAACFVLSSNEEGLGIVILEAMASGLAVACTQCGGPDTIVLNGKTGFLSPVGDAVALGNNLARLLSEPAMRCEMGRTAREIVLARFSLAAAGQVYLDKYDQLLAM